MAASSNTSSNLSDPILEVLQSVTTGEGTVSGVPGHTGNWAGHYSVGSANDTWMNGTGLATTNSNNKEDYLWLTLRLFFIACVITGLIVLTWGSYTIHRKCFDGRPKRKYQKALLL